MFNSARLIVTTYMTTRRRENSLDYLLTRDRVAAVQTDQLALTMCFSVGAAFDFHPHKGLFHQYTGSIIDKNNNNTDYNAILCL